MKRIIVAIIIVITVITLVLAVSNLPYYTMRYCKVVSQEGNVVTFVDNTGHEWAFECADDAVFTEGELIKVKMHDAWTEERLDDRVVGVERW